MTDHQPASLPIDQVPPVPSVGDPNLVDPRVFPHTAQRDPAGELVISGVRATELVRTYGSPLYVVDESVARERARETKAAFDRAAARVGTTATVYYASKAFLCVAVAQWMADEGLAIDVASGGELSVALAAGVEPARIGFHGNNKSTAEIARAVDAGVGTIILDSEEEIARVAVAAGAVGRKQRVRLRVNSGVHASTHDYLATSHEDQKFGVPLADAPRLVADIVAHEGLDFVGLHCHIGSQIFATDGFRESAKRLMSVYGELAKIVGHDIPELNLGGGFGIAYVPQEVAQVPDIAEIADGILDSVAAVASQLDLTLPKLAFEPGRSLLGPAGVTLYTVGTTKSVAVLGTGAAGAAQTLRGAAAGAQIDTSTRCYVSVDGGMSDNARPALYGSDYHVRIANRVSDAEAALVRVVGKHCESGDIVVDQDVLPGDISAGDVLAVAATGAYCWSLSSNYNYVPRPPVVSVRDGGASLIVRGETEDELLRKSVY